MKRIVAGICIVAFALVFPSCLTSAQERDGGARGRASRGTGQNRGRRRRYYQGRYEWYEDPAGAAGAAAAGWLWRQLRPAPAEKPVEPVKDVRWCVNRYHSYNPKTGQYLGYDGRYHDCP